MNPKIFNEALQATARIACCAGLVGLVACQTKADDSASNTDTSVVAEPEEQVAEPENEIVVPEEPNFEECMTAIDAGFADENFDTSTLLDCCMLTTEEVGYMELYENPDYASLQENCCEEIAQQGEFSSACTPWGPPTPPCMNTGSAHA